MPVPFRFRVDLPVRASIYIAVRASDWQSERSFLANKAIPETKRFRRFHRIVNWAYRQSPLYRRLCATEGVVPSDLRSFQDIRKLPILDKELVRRESANLITMRQSWLDSAKTGGSTGVPLKLYRSPIENAVMGATWERAYRYHGINLNFLSATRLMRLLHPVDFYNSKHRQLLELSVNLPEETIADLTEEFQPRVVEGYPTDLDMLAREFERRGTSIGFDKIVTHSELLVPGTRARLERTFGCKVVDFYGAQEFGCLAWQCKAGHYHLNSDYFHIEVLDSKGEKTEKGEIVVSNFYSFGMPLIRYRLGDIVEQGPEEVSNCGVGLPQVKVIEGKIYDFLVRADGSMISPHTVRQALSKISGIASFRVVQEADRSLELFAVPSVPSADFERHFRQNALLMLRDIFGEGVDISVIFVPRIERGSGSKFKSVVRAN